MISKIHPNKNNIFCIEFGRDFGCQLGGEMDGLGVYIKYKKKQYIALYDNIKSEIIDFKIKKYEEKM